MADHEQQPRVLGVAAMKALGHPIRARLLNELAAHGSSTATALGQQIGESSGSTSYHLRQLAVHGLVEEVPGLGSARERYWRRVPGPVQFGSSDAPDGPADRTATAIAALSFQDASHDLIRGVIATLPEMPAGWRDATDFSNAWLRLTPAEATELSERLYRVVTGYRRADATDGDAPDAEQRRVYVSLNVVPILDDRAVPAQPTPDPRVADDAAPTTTTDDGAPA